MLGREVQESERHAVHACVSALTALMALLRLFMSALLPSTALLMLYMPSLLPEVARVILTKGKLTWRASARQPASAPSTFARPESNTLRLSTRHRCHNTLHLNTRHRSYNTPPGNNKTYTRTGEKDAKSTRAQDLLVDALCGVGARAAEPEHARQTAKAAAYTPPDTRTVSPPTHR
eukprot:2541824-Rhodomonas_salina.1